jgi:PIN domain nuclease of toxin-antitoxin system
MKKYLLDTHSIIWFLEDPQKLSEKALFNMELLINECFVPIVSLYEIAIKLNIGKLQIKISINNLKEEIIRVGSKYYLLKLAILKNILN